MAMTKTIAGAALAALLISACGGERDAQPPPQTPPPPAPVAAPAPEPVSAPEPPKPSLLELEKESVRARMAALNAHEAAKFAEGFTPDGIAITYGVAEAKGREAIASDVQKFFDGFPDFKIAESNVYVKGDVVVVEWVVNGTHKGEFAGVKPTNQPVGIRGATVLWVSPEGLVKQEHRYMDGSTIMAQLGQSKGPARPVQALPSTEAVWHLAKGTPEEDKQSEVVKAMNAAFEKKAEADFLAMIAEDAAWSDVSGPRDVVGKSESKKAFQAFTKAFPDAKISIETIFSVDDRTISESTMSGTHLGALGPLKATKKPVSLHTLDIATVQDGKLRGGTSYSNSVEMLAQLGLLPKPKAAKTDAKADAKKPVADQGGEKKAPEKADKADKSASAKSETTADKPKGAPKLDKK
jgi:steroid delta-isomerase-like uncharacterized protein/uncharacterized protein (TIGR02246 family)